MNRYVCIHGHFYQPPRENAWLEAVEVQPTASPYHDWNERVTSECYWPNCASQILDKDNRITQIANNYAKISFDFGPTLLSWLQTEAPDVYQTVLDADKESQKTFSGHGSALAQAYNHLIMPLANHRDKYTQVVWGLRDFELRFKRQAEGMWLPETAVDLDTLDIMAELGIKFTILAPSQAARVRPMGKKEWHDVSGDRIDTVIPYQVNLPSGRKISVFFYYGPIANAVAFHGQLENGQAFAQALADIVPHDPVAPRLAHIATDGESYGHHHRFGDMALAYALHYIESQNLARITNYAEFLEICPPTDEVAIIENSSWSCAHGVERWRSDCGCSDHYHPGWNQAWRAPLRNAMDWLRDNITPQFEEQAKTLFRDPWQARDNYITVLFDRSPENVQRFLNTHGAHSLSAEEQVTALKFMELQRHAMLMYTSCGWFFDDLARIESVQIIHYAGRVVQLAQELFGDTTENRFLERLGKAKSNRSDYGNGRQIYDRFVTPTKLDLKKVAGHFAVRSVVVRSGDSEQTYSYRVQVNNLEGFMCGQMDVNFGRITVTSAVTGESLDAEFLVIYHEKGGATAGVGKFSGDQEYKRVIDEISAACSVNDSVRLEHFLEQNYTDSIFTINSLFKDTQYMLLEKAMQLTTEEIQPLFYPELHTYATVTPLVNDIDNPLPEAFRPLVELMLNLDLRRQLSSRAPDTGLVRRMLTDARLWQIPLEGEHLGYVFSKSLNTEIQLFLSRVEDKGLLDKLTDMVLLAKSLPFPVNLHRLQYHFFSLVQTRYEEFAERGDKEWISKFRRLGNALLVKLP